MHDFYLPLRFRSLCSLILLNCLVTGFRSTTAADESKEVASRSLTVTSDFPGGNIVVEKIEGDVVQLRQDERDTSRFWFYWCFQVNGAESRTVRFNFTNGNVFGSRGPAVSTDKGHSWSWLGPDACDGDSFVYKFPANASRVRFAFAVPYTTTNLDQFLQQHKDHPSLGSYELVRTVNQRVVEIVRAGQLNGKPKYRVLLTARHHACESIANFVLEGIWETVLENSDLGRWTREHVEILAVPFMDKDGVEAGDQGKMRQPYDHWLDYHENSRYAESRALRYLIEAEVKRQPIDVALDIHCPYIRDTRIFFALGSDPRISASSTHFCRLLEQHQQGSLTYHVEDNLLFGTKWNVQETYAGRRSFWQWAETLPKIRAVATLEVPYALVRGVTVTPEAAREFGGDLVHALRAFLETN